MYYTYKYTIKSLIFPKLHFEFALLDKFNFKKKSFFLKLKIIERCAHKCLLIISYLFCLISFIRRDKRDHMTFATVLRVISTIPPFQTAVQ